MSKFVFDYLKTHIFRVIFPTLALGILTFSCSREQSKAARKTYSVILVNPIEKDVPIYIEVYGNVYSLQSVDIRPQVGGIIQEAFVKQGQYVKKGDPLYQIDPRPYQAALEQARANLLKDYATLEFNQSVVSRYTDLLKQNFVSKLNYDQYLTNTETAHSQVLNDQAAIALAELNLEWTKPVSPIDGKISQYFIDPGNLVTANDPIALTNVRQISPADIRFYVTQKDFVHIQTSILEGMLKFEAILPQSSNSPREGEIYFIDNHIDLSTGTILIKGIVANEDEFFWPGEFVRVRLQLRIHPDALLLPQEAVSMGQEGPFVYIYKDSDQTVEYRKVIKGPTIDHMVVIENGISKVDKVVLRGQVNLRPGVKVSVIAQKDTLNPAPESIK